MGESQFVVGIQVYGPSRLGRRAGGFGPTTSWRRETCPDSFSHPHTWVQARSPTTSAFLEVRQPAQSRRPTGEALHLHMAWLTSIQNTLQSPTTHSRPCTEASFPSVSILLTFEPMTFAPALSLHFQTKMARERKP